MNVERELPSQIHIMRCKPSDFTVDDYHQLGFVDLIVNGYGNPPELSEEQAIEEFGGDDACKDMFCAFDGKTVVSALVLNNWSALQSERGKVFWEKLRELNLDIAERAESYSEYACDIGGTVTLPKYRSQGIMSKLIKQAKRELAPSLIVGRTKTVEAVQSRVRAWDGMTVYYGGINVTPGANPFDNAPAAALNNAYFSARQLNEISDDKGIIYVPSSFLSPAIPDVSNVSVNMQIAFQPIIKRQIELNREGRQTALFPLISVIKPAINGIV